MSQLVTPYRWSPTEFLRAHDAEVFHGRVELVEGEVWPVVIGSWHGKTVMRVARALPGDEVEITTETLASGDSLPDPDCWVQRQGAKPRGELGGRLSLWRPEDVLLVVEVSDETLHADLMIKARVYGSAGYAVYWVVSPDVVYVHTSPIPGGYAQQTEHRRGDRVRLPYVDVELVVDDLLG